MELKVVDSITRDTKKRHQALAESGMEDPAEGECRHIQLCHL